MVLRFEAEGVVMSGDFQINFDDLSFTGTPATSERVKVSELLLFFYRFKAGHYGHFYGTVDPMVITCALRDFVAERNSLITACEQRRLEQLSEQRRQTAITYEQWLKIKQQQPEHEIPTNHPNR